MRSVLLSSILALTFLGVGAAHGAAQPSVCMKCHGNEEALKVMVEPVIHGSSEGEG